MKVLLKAFIFLTFCLFLSGCLPRAMNGAYMGMSIQDFMMFSNNTATLERMQDSVSVYRYRWADVGDTHPYNSTFYYFKNGKLFEINEGKLKNPVNVRLNYNLN